MNQIKLAPCPFCFGEADLFTNNNEYDRVTRGSAMVRCKQCPCSLQWYSYSEDAIRAWNTRRSATPPLPQPVKEAQEVKAVRAWAVIGDHDKLMPLDGFRWHRYQAQEVADRIRSNGYGNHSVIEVEIRPVNSTKTEGEESQDCRDYRNMYEDAYAELHAERKRREELEKKHITLQEDFKILSMGSIKKFDKISTLESKLSAHRKALEVAREALKHADPDHASFKAGEAIKMINSILDVS